MSKPNKPNLPVDAGTEVDDEPSAAAYRAACVTACKSQADCLQLSESQCESDCKVQSGLLRASCYDEATDEQECLQDLSCEQTKAYAIEGRRQHPVCGAVARAYFAACTLGEGAIPEQCTALCERYVECDASEVSQAACEESCTLQATSFQDDSAPCGEAFLAFIGCGAQANCGEAQALASDSLAPVACNDELASVEATCKR